MTIQEVLLPAQSGCRHLHLTIELDDLSIYTVAWHITDFNDADKLAVNRGDSIFNAIANVVEGTYDLSTVTREEIKALIEETEI